MAVSFPEKYHCARRYFDAAFGDVETASGLDDSKKLVLYALRQQADHGPCKEPAPYVWNIRARYKHSAWSHLGNMSQFEAMVHFVQQMEESLGPGHADWLQRVRLEGACAANASASSEPSVANGRCDHNENTDLDDLQEPTPHNIEALTREIIALRQLLRQHGIAFGAISQQPQSSSSNKLSSVEARRGESGTVTPIARSSTACAQQSFVEGVERADRGIVGTELSDSSASSTHDGNGVATASPVSAAGQPEMNGKEASQAVLVPPLKPREAALPVPPPTVRVTPWIMAREASRMPSEAVQPSALSGSPPGWAEWLGLI